jgi:hypothetical protein
LIPTKSAPLLQLPENGIFLSPSLKFSKSASSVKKPFENCFPTLLAKLHLKARKYID